MSYVTTLPRKPNATGSESHVGSTACENSPKLITGNFNLIRAASLGLICMTDDLINRCAPLSGTEILETLDQMDLLLGLIRYEVRSWLCGTEDVKTLLEIDMAEIDAAVIQILCQF
ncbi:hypothetical protein FOQG_17238 [Fusarium oxysporum f. sp. raphani 54005]|uniref:Uncharacterized protein n=1 Tax=Fusarium oxysporum f. sp. raphani 54005 TaxID=1089458 RepID=X0BHW8_FUSOX|nr:hypothetical protein FOQG_17238 [Fusarium oxysporum f. sp. raphani 54005]